MGKPFGNWFAHSTSGWKNFEECPRKWWWQKSGSWKGWSARDGTWKRRSYVLKKMESIRQLTGTIIHEAAEQIVKTHPDIEIELEKAKAWADGRMREAWRGSKSGRWKRDPKNVSNLFEHYYDQRPFLIPEFDQESSVAYLEAARSAEHEHDPEDVLGAKLGALFLSLTEAGKLAPADDWIEAAREHWMKANDPAREQFEKGRTLVHACISCLAMHDRMHAARRSKVRSVEVLDEVDFDGVDTWVKRDLIYLDEATGILWVIDWKSGRRRRDDVEQAITYAVPLMRALKPGQQAKAALIYLPMGDEVVIDLNDEVAKRATAEVKMRADTIRERLYDPAKNHAPADHFPPTGTDSSCQRCEFFELCYGTRDHSARDIVELEGA